MSYQNLSQAENDFLRHISMWGSAGYPVRKLGRGWIVSDFWGVKGPPKVYRTKREVVAYVELFLEILRDKAAGRLAA